MNKVRYGIVGIGKMGSTHAKKLKKGLDKNATVTAVSDILDERKTWAEANLPDVAFYTDYKDLISDSNVDVVVVATQHYSHPIIAMEALRAGKHVLVEKPAGVYTKTVRQLNELAAEYPNQLFGIMFNQRTNPLYKRAKQILESGEMGELKRINWVITDWYRPQAYYDNGGWRGTWGGEGGGVLINQCPHQLDLFQWLGGMPTKVRGYAYTRNRDISVENDVTFYTEYQNGATGVFVTSTHDIPGSNRLEIACDKGKMVIEHTFLGIKGKLTIEKFDVGEKEFNATNQKFMPIMRGKKKTYRTGMIGNAYKLGLVGQHMNVFRNFSLAVQGRDELLARGYEGILSLTLSNAVHLSTWLDKDIYLPIDEEEYLTELKKRVDEENCPTNLFA